MTGAGATDRRDDENIAPFGQFHRRCVIGMRDIVTLAPVVIADGHIKSGCPLGHLGANLAITEYAELLARGDWL